MDFFSEKKDENLFSIYEYNGQQQENLINELTISEGINRDIVISNENNSYEMNISSINPTLGNFISYDDDEKSINICSKYSNKNNYLKALEIFGNFDINHQAYNEKYIKENIEFGESDFEIDIKK